MDLLGQPIYLARKLKGDNSISVKQANAKVCSVVGPASPVRMVKPKLVKSKFPVVNQEPTAAYPNFRRLRYVRYADDFLLGFIGPKEEAEEIKQQLEAYLRDDLKLELSRTKTLITHARTQTAKFLGYEVHVNQVDTKRARTHQKDGTTYKRRSINGQIGLRVPERVAKEKSQAYMQRGKAVHRTELTTMSAYEIVSTYQAEYRGLVEYYRMAYNLSGPLSKLRWTMETSLTKTLATKFKVSVPEVYRRYRATLEKDGQPSKGLQVTQQREGKKPLVATWGGISLKWKAKAVLNDQPPKLWEGYSELVERLLVGECEWCGQGPVEGHHIHALKDINKAHPGREKPEWAYMMIARQRKVMFLCRECHQDVTFGRPMRNTKRYNLKPMARLISWGVVGVPPEIMGIGPAPAIRQALKRADLRLSDPDRVEVNEAFSSQYLAVEKDLGLERDKTNLNGGAISIGHPLAARGARLTITLMYELRPSKKLDKLLNLG